MAIDQQTVQKLAALYAKRSRLEKLRTCSLDHHFWVSIVADLFKGTGTRASVAEELGGGETPSEWFRAIADQRFNELLGAVDAEIIESGGEV